MTLASDIIQRAYRESNLIALGATPSTNQASEGLTRLNGVLLSTVGGEVSDDLVDLNIGGNYSETEVTDQWVPDNARLMFKLTAAKTFYLDPFPQNGQRLGVVDVDGNLGTYNVTLNGNGRNIEGASTLTLNTNSLQRQWLYRADTGNWVRISSLLAGDTMPFPEEFDDFFVIMLSLRINPMYAQEMTAETIKYINRIRNMLRARYNLNKEVSPDVPYLDNDYKNGNYFTASNDFELGRPNRWR